MFPFLSQLSAAVTQLKTDAEAAYTALDRDWETGWVTLWFCYKALKFGKNFVAGL